MNLFHGGKLAAMPPKLLNDDGDVEVLRPLIYCAEPDLAKFAEAHGVPDHPLRPLRLAGRAAAQCHEGDARRHRAPHARAARTSMIRALGNVRPRHLLDPKLFDFGAFWWGGPAENAHALEDRDIGWTCRHPRRRGARKSCRASAGWAAATCARKPRPPTSSPRPTKAERLIAEASRRCPRRCSWARRLGSPRSSLPRLGAAELAVVVDPVDGTANFAAGLPLFAVMAAVVKEARRSPASSTTRWATTGSSAREGPARGFVGPKAPTSG